MSVLWQKLHEIIIINYDNTSATICAIFVHFNQPFFPPVQMRIVITDANAAFLFYYLISFIIFILSITNRQALFIAKHPGHPGCSIL